MAKIQAAVSYKLVSYVRVLTVFKPDSHGFLSSSYMSGKGKGKLIRKFDTGN